MFKHTKGMDWDLVNRYHARRLVSELSRAMPGGWGRAVELLAVVPADVPVWMRSRAWLDKLQEFKKLHGDASAWNISDDAVVTKAKDCAEWVGQILELKSPDCLDIEKLDKVRSLCDAVGVEWPVSLTAVGAVNRALCEVWWRRSLRRKVARVVEHGAIKLGIVNKRDGGYCTDTAVRRRKQQIARNAAMLDRSLMRNEAGQVFSLAELAKKSVANPEIRGGELMVRIRGCEEFADTAGHAGYFLTLTCPSRFHAVQAGGKGRRAVIRPNPKYDGVSTPRDAQLWLRGAWAKVRAAWARKGIECYGFRVAEPHHDGCPHWHALLWFADDAVALDALRVLGHHWLSDGGPVDAYPSRETVMVYRGAVGSSHEAGSLKNRVNIKRMQAGGAAGYVAKYVAKNIGHFDVGQYQDQQGMQVLDVDTREYKGWERVDAWAATWGIRQFAAIGQPSVTIWREMRRVTKDQIDTAQMCGDKVASKVWHAVQKFGNVGADWCRFMTHMGGVCKSRLAYLIQPKKRINDKVNGYGELITEKRVIGCSLPRSGRVLVSRRQSWAHVGAEVGTQTSEEREALGAPWTRFNNCTARLGHKWRAAMAGLKTLDFRDAWGPLPGHGPGWIPGLGSVA